MRTRIFNEICILILIMMILLSPAYSVSPYSELVVSLSDSVSDPLRQNTQKKFFMFGTRLFVFFSDGGFMQYSHRSVDDRYWSDPIKIISCTNGSRFSVALEKENNNGYVHYARVKFTNGDQNVYYRKGKLLLNGLINWVKSEQTIVWHSIITNGRIGNPYITVDSSGYPIIFAYYQKGTAYWNTTVNRSSKKDGTWETDLTKSWLYNAVPDPEYAWQVGVVLPLLSRKFMIITVRGDSTNRGYYYNGSVFQKTEDIFPNLIGEFSVYNSAHQQKWSAVAESGNDVVHIVYNRKGTSGAITIPHFSHQKWNVSGWFDIVSYPNKQHYNWSVSVRPQLSLNAVNNEMRCSWLEYPDSNKIYCMDWDGGSWTDPKVWLTESNDIIEHEDFSSIYGSSSRYAVLYLTESSRNIILLSEPPLLIPAQVISIPPYEDYIPIAMGFTGLGIFAFLPLILIIKIRKKDYDWVIWSIMLFIIALGLVIGWLWG